MGWGILCKLLSCPLISLDGDIVQPCWFIQSMCRYDLIKKSDFRFCDCYKMFNSKVILTELPFNILSFCWKIPQWIQYLSQALRRAVTHYKEHCLAITACYHQVTATADHSQPCWINTGIKSFSWWKKKQIPFKFVYYDVSRLYFWVSVF